MAPGDPPEESGPGCVTGMPPGRTGTSQRGQSTFPFIWTHVSGVTAKKVQDTQRESSHQRGTHPGVHGTQHHALTIPLSRVSPSGFFLPSELDGLRTGVLPMTGNRCAAGLVLAGRAYGCRGYLGSQPICRSDETLDEEVWVLGAAPPCETSMPSWG